MNWLFGVIGAFLGIALSEDRNVLGFVLGFAVAFLATTVIRQGRRLDTLAAEMTKLRRVAPTPAPAELPATPPAAAAPSTGSATAARTRRRSRRQGPVRRR